MGHASPSHRPALYTNLYVDMDGCLSDFKSFYEKYDARGVEAPGEIENAVKFKAAILDGIFERLTVMPNFHSLIQGISEIQEETGIEVHVLSSTGTLKMPELYDEVVRQKRAWLARHAIPWTPFFSPNKLGKVKFASHSSILVDDRPGCVEPFKEAGGTGILHKDEDVEATLGKIRSVLCDG